MLHDVEYDKLPDNLKGLLSEAERHHNSLLAPKARMCAALRQQGFIPDNRIEMIRVKDAKNYERIIDLSQSENGNAVTNARLKGKLT